MPSCTTLCVVGVTGTTGKLVMSTKLVLRQVQSKGGLEVLWWFNDFDRLY